jgi:hypothetical protein
LAQSEIVNGDNGLSLQLTGNKRDDKQRYYDRFYSDPHYYRDRAWILHRSDLAVNSPGFGSC